jgi:hypothetical protein
MRPWDATFLSNTILVFSFQLMRRMVMMMMMTMVVMMMMLMVMVMDDVNPF